MLLRLFAFLCDGLPVEKVTAGVSLSLANRGDWNCAARGFIMEVLWRSLYEFVLFVPKNLN
jgi:hypothetical protein